MGIRFDKTAAALGLAAAALAASGGAVAQNRPTRVDGHPEPQRHLAGGEYGLLESRGALGRGPRRVLAARRARRHPGRARASSSAVRSRTSRRRWPSARRTGRAGRLPTPWPSATCPAFRGRRTSRFRSRSCKATATSLFAYAFAKANRPVHMSHQVDEAPIDQWMGWSNGHWEGDTLVVRVTSNDDRTWFDRAGDYHSNRMVVTERYTLAGPDDASLRGHDRRSGGLHAALDHPRCRCTATSSRTQSCSSTTASSSRRSCLYGKLLKKPGRIGRSARSR